ncbi:MAG: ParB/RepB/Spo0J family partition protein [Clostridia bacterium]|nr:ParB/RepB/Spo0J family partition protein [Clostridia bacterium]
MHTVADRKLFMLKPEEIVSNTYKSRKRFDEYELKRLADSISANGIIEPLIVRKTDDGKYELIAGERRLRAAKLAGLRRVPCILHITDDITAVVYSINENSQRCNLSFFEQALSIKKLTDDFGLSQSEVAIRLGIAQSTLCNKLRLLRLDESIRNRIDSANLTERHAMALLRLDESKRNEVLDKIISKNLSVYQAEELVENILYPFEKENTETDDNIPPVRKTAIGDIRLFSNSLSKLLTTMQNAGVDATSKKYETEKYIEYKVRIKKTPAQNSFEQLKIC